jgi:hypothetical protein
VLRQRHINSLLCQDLVSRSCESVCLSTAHPKLWSDLHGWQVSAKAKMLAPNSVVKSDWRPEERCL